MDKAIALLAALALAACGSDGGGETMPEDAVAVRIIAFNDYHGSIEPAPAREYDVAEGEKRPILAGGAAYLAAAVNQARAEDPNLLVLSAGDLLGGSPEISADFLDEPTIAVMNRIGLDYHTVGNHEFDRGVPELQRLASGGCETFTSVQPCRVESFEGAQFDFLAANTMRDGNPLFAASAMREFGSGAGAVQVGIIGVTLRATPQATEGSTEGLTFTDEAEAINAEARRLREAGADAVIVLAHQGLEPLANVPVNGCGTIGGPLSAILERIEPGVDAVLSGHTHRAYICDYGTVDPDRPMVVTSTLSSGTMVTDIRLMVSPGRSAVVSRSAKNVFLQRKGSDAKGTPVLPDERFPVFDPDPETEAIVNRYRRTGG